MSIVQMEVAREAVRRWAGITLTEPEKARRGFGVSIALDARLQQGIR